MKLEQILIVPKLTKFEWDMYRLKLTEQELRNFYDKQGVRTSKILDSHKKQKAGFERLVNMLKGAHIANRDDLTKDLAMKYSLIIAFGGDNHFQYVSHFVDGTPILGINSDPERSEGALTSLSSDTLENYIPLIISDGFEMEEWARLKASIDGKGINELSVSEIFIGEEKRYNISRHIITKDGKSEEQKGSGLLIVTGAGSTGWYDSACRYLFSEGNKFPKNLSEARYILTEPYNGKLSSLTSIHGSIKEGEEIEVTSLSDDKAFLSVDCLHFFPLREGAKVKIKLDTPLRVVRLK